MAAKRKITTGLLLITAAVFSGVALYSFDPRDWGSFLSARNLCGPLGAVLAGSLRWAAGGVVSWAVPIFLFFWGWVQVTRKDLRDYARLLVCSGLLAILVPAILSSLIDPEAGGLIGKKTFGFFELISGRIGSLIILFAASITICLLLVFGSFRVLADRISGLGQILARRGTGEKKKKERKKKTAGKKRKAASARARRDEEVAEFDEEIEPEFVEIDIPAPRKRKPVPRPRPVAKAPESSAAGTTPADNAPLPDLSLLDDYDESTISYSKEDLIARSEIIESKLEDYGLKGKIQKVLPGPVVTTFEFVPAPGVKVSQIANRADDISLALAARALRIQAPIPGRGAVGIEVPNPEPKLVLMKELMEHFPPAEDGLMVCVGKSVTGEPVFVDIAEMPHLLIAGATGSGKSVCINTLICSLLFNHTPATCRFVLIDPKRLELITYNNIPHLLHPVITEAKQSLKVLNFLTIEMDRRYKLLAQFGVKNIKGFNDRVASDKICDKTTGEPLAVLPYYVCIIDELADIMVTLGNEIYPPITRLAQMARAVGIHLVFATQRPSVDVVTGLIKANFPSRMAFQVTSKTDSRTILDVNGAETLLGNGDMLYLPKNLPAPVRIQGAYISERETENVASYWRSFQGGEAIDLNPDAGPDPDGSADIDDDLYEKAKELVIMHQQGSISLVQRRLRVGYARAARLIDMLEQSGVVGPFEGSKAREVLISREEYEGI